MGYIIHQAHRRVMPTGRLRFVYCGGREVLQQEWGEMEALFNGVPVFIHCEWRDVPREEAAAEKENAS